MQVKTGYASAWPKIERDMRLWKCRSNISALYGQDRGKIGRKARKRTKLTSIPSFTWVQV